MFIRIKIFPGCKKTEIIKKSENNFEIKVKEKPLQGRANKAVIKELSNLFKIGEKDIRIIKGHKRRNKILEIKK